MSLMRNPPLAFITVVLFCLTSISCIENLVYGGGSLEKLSKSNLEKIKQSAISYLKTKKPLNWEIHLAEIERGAILDLGQEQRIGRWVVTTKDDSVLLVRDADITQEVRRFGLVFTKTGNEYVVTNEFWERESFY